MSPYIIGPRGDHGGPKHESDAVIDCNCRLNVECCGSRVASDAGSTVFRELDEVFNSTTLAGALLPDGDCAGNMRRVPSSLWRQSVCGQLAGHDRRVGNLATRWIVGRVLVLMWSPDHLANLVP